MKLGLSLVLLAALDLSQTDFHHLLAEHGFITHTPAQIDSLERAPCALQRLLSAGNTFSLDGIPLFNQILKCRADEEPKGRRGNRHRVPLCVILAERINRD